MKNKIEAPTTANCVFQVSEEDNENEAGKTDPKISTLRLSSNEWRNDVLYYISGYIVKKFCKSLIVLSVQVLYMIIQIYLATTGLHKENHS